LQGRLIEVIYMNKNTYDRDLKGETPSLSGLPRESRGPSVQREIGPQVTSANGSFTIASFRAVNKKRTLLSYNHGRRRLTKERVV